MAKHPMMWFVIGILLGYFAVPFVIAAISGIGK